MAERLQAAGLRVARLQAAGLKAARLQVAGLKATRLQATELKAARRQAAGLQVTTDEAAGGRASPKWLAAAPSGPGRVPGAFEAEARLVVRSSELLYRALRSNEVRYEEGVVVGLRNGKLMPRQRASMSMQRAVEEGSKLHCSKYVHITADVTAAVYLARSGSTTP